MEPTSLPVIPPDGHAGCGGAPLREEDHARLTSALHVWASLRMRPFLRSFMGPEDVVQETWQRALEFHDRFDRDQCTYRGFLFGIAKNVLLEASRRAERRNRLGQSLGKRESGINLDRIADDITNVSRRVARDERITRVLKLCGTLSPTERDLLLHLGLEGMGQQEVATMLAITRDALNKRWQRLKAQLLEAGLPSELVGD